MRKLAFALLAGVTFGAISVAYASDLPARMPRKAPAQVYAPIPFTWTGFYVGANAGWGWGSGDGTVTIDAIDLCRILSGRGTPTGVLRHPFPL